MTLIATYLDQYSVMQASDRVVSKARGKKIDTYDAKFNKTVIYSCTDAVICISYTGLAYIEGLPTDKWIVEKLTGDSLDIDFFVRYLPPSNYSKLSESLYRLKLALEDASSEIARYKPHDYVEFCVSGWKLTQFELGLRVQPVDYKILRARGSHEVQISHGIPRHRPRHSSALRTAGVSPPAELIESSFRLFSEAKSYDDIESVIVRLIRETSRVDSTVGGNCTVVRFSLSDVEDGYIRATYWRDPSNVDELPMYGPWLVGRDLIVAPSEIHGEGAKVDLAFAPLSVKIMSSEVSKPWLRAGKKPQKFGFQPRKPAP